MTELNSIQEIFFAFLQQYHFREEDLDYSVLPGHINALQTLAEVSNSGVSIFDVNKREIVFFSSNYGKMLGYKPEDYQHLNYRFFEERMHPDERYRLALQGVSAFKMFNAFTREEKLSHKIISEFRMLNAEGRYVRLVEQYQILELDKTGQVWLMMNIVDISPYQEEDTATFKKQLLNFKTGNLLSFEFDNQVSLELTKREQEILQLVKQGLLSKEISDKLSISVHTVNTHRQRFLEKLGANNSVEAIRIASRFGLLE